MQKVVGCRTGRCDRRWDLSTRNWHMLTQPHHPDLTARVRVLECTVTAPIPAFVANPLFLLKWSIASPSVFNRRAIPALARPIAARSPTPVVRDRTSHPPTFLQPSLLCMSAMASQQRSGMIAAVTTQVTG